MKPARKIGHLPWRDEMPDEEGYWWFRRPVMPEHGFVEYVYPQEIDGTDTLQLDTLDISKMTPERWAEEGWQCTPVVLPSFRKAPGVLSDLTEYTAKQRLHEIPIPSGAAGWAQDESEVPDMCPECGGSTQWTHLTPPDDGIAYACTACPWPNPEENDG